MKMRGHALCAFACAFLAGGCVLSLNTLFTSNDVVFDPALEGTWQKDGWIWEFKGVDTTRGRYSLRVSAKDQETADFEATLGTVGNHRFLELAPKRPGVIHMRSFFGGHFIEFYSFWKTDLQGDVLALTSMSSEWLSAMIKQQKIDIKFERRGKDGVPVLTAPTQELRAFVSKYAEDTSAFPTSGTEGVFSLVRVKLKGQAPAPGAVPTTSLTLEKATDADLAALTGWKDLRELNVAQSRITDASRPAA